MGHALSQKGLYTTGQVARLCRCGSRTVNGWVDAGLLRGYRLPGGGDRRVTAEALLAFLLAQGMPVPPELAAEAAPALLVLTADGDLAAGLALALPAWRVLRAADLFELGLLAQANAPAAAVLDLALGTADGLLAARRIGELWPDCRLVVLTGEDGAGSAEARALGACVLVRPAPAADVARAAAGGGKGVADGQA
jgi:two-component system, OmpR family, response regulator RpaA